MAAKLFSLVVAGHWSPVSAATFCCATKVIGWNAGALHFEEATDNDVKSKGTLGYHCGRGLPLHLSWLTSGTSWAHSECNLTEWIESVQDQPKAFVDIGGLFNDIETTFRTMWDKPDETNRDTITGKIPYYYKKLQAQAAYFARDFTRGKGNIYQSSKQSALMFGMAKVTAVLRIKCKCHNKFDNNKVVQHLLCSKDGQFSDTQCDQLSTKKEALRESYCDEWKAVIGDKKVGGCLSALQRHENLCRKIGYWASTSAAGGKYGD